MLAIQYLWTQEQPEECCWQLMFCLLALAAVTSNCTQDLISQYSHDPSCHSYIYMAPMVLCMSLCSTLIEVLLGQVLACPTLTWSTASVSVYINYWALTSFAPAASICIYSMYIYAPYVWLTIYFHLQNGEDGRPWWQPEECCWQLMFCLLVMVAATTAFKFFTLNLHTWAYNCIAEVVCHITTQFIVY